MNTRKVNRECPVCGTSYEADPVRLSHGRQTTCSRSCSYIQRGQTLQRRETIQCAVCKIEFSRRPSQIKAKHGANYCSRACHYLGRTLGLTPRIITEPYVRVAPVNFDAIQRTVATRKQRNNYGHSEATITKLREATTRSIAEGRVPRVSQLENEVAAELDNLRINYQRQVPLRGSLGRYVACADFQLETGHVIEVNGTFWHSDPRVYPNGPIHPSQIRSKERWDRKVSALNSLKIPLIILWEIDLRNNLPETVAVALAGI